MLRPEPGRVLAHHAERGTAQYGESGAGKAAEDRGAEEPREVRRFVFRDGFVHGVEAEEDGLKFL